MTRPAQKTIKNQLASETNARALSQLKMGSERLLTVWSNSNDLVHYKHAEGHTFSFYLQGGEGVSRVDHDYGPGSPGAICIMPQGHSSTWKVTKPFNFLHVYLSDQELRRQFAYMFDKDARLLDVREHTFMHSADLSPIFIHIQKAISYENTMMAEEAISELINSAVSQDIVGQVRKPVLTGGLSPGKLKSVKEYMMEKSGENISLKELAELVHLSEFHFQRNFKAQCGVSPHIWLTCQRIEHAKEFLRQNQSQAEIATTCGFSSQSHFSRTFRHYTGITPGKYAQYFLS